MVMGFDVNHPQPGSTKPSYSALFAFLDKECSRGFTVVGASCAPLASLVHQPLPPITRGSPF